MVDCLNALASSNLFFNFCKSCKATMNLNFSSYIKNFNNSFKNFKKVCTALLHLTIRKKNSISLYNNIKAYFHHRMEC